MRKETKPIVINLIVCLLTFAAIAFMQFENLGLFKQEAGALGKLVDLEEDKDKTGDHAYIYFYYTAENSKDYCYLDIRDHHHHGEGGGIAHRISIGLNDKLCAALDKERHQAWNRFGAVIDGRPGHAKEAK